MSDIPDPPGRYYAGIMRRTCAAMCLSGCLIMLTAQTAGARSSEADLHPDRKDPYFQRSSDLIVGAKGEDVLDVSVSDSCPGPVQAFDHAELIIDRNRFGDALFVQIPESGCIRCRPLKIRWYHEPTGYLSFRVRVWRRSQPAACEDGRSAGSELSSEAIGEKLP